MNVLDYIEKTKNGNMQTSKACFEENLMDKNFFACKESSLAGKAKKYVSKAKFVQETCFEDYPNVDLFISNQREDMGATSCLVDTLTFSVDNAALDISFYPTTKERKSFVAISVNDDEQVEKLNWKEAKEYLKGIVFTDEVANELPGVDSEEEEEEEAPVEEGSNEPGDKLPGITEDLYPDDDSFEI